MNNTIVLQPERALTRQDFLSDTEPRWCAGCGCHAIFKAWTNVLPKLGYPKEDFALISGIGCSSRLPYYADTYGMHSIHGRAPTIAMGVKLANPNLSVWVVTGDGDALSIGGNHFIHLMRRNPDINVMLFNNQIYGLTKGQTSPTSPAGTKTKTSPFGSVEAPFHPCSMAIASGATFVARVADRDMKMMEEVMYAAARHNGISFIEILENCMIFNDGVFSPLTDKKTRDDTTLVLEHGKPLIFGKNRDKGIRLKDAEMEIVTLGQNGVTEKDVLIHDITRSSTTMAFLLSQFEYPNEPVPLGIFRSVDRPTFEQEVRGQEKFAEEKLGKPSLENLLKSGDTWEVDEQGHTSFN
jgi:2-oxoglutarate/2-oxoacid ferredoxin oxidoreductase subunit beta